MVQGGRGEDQSFRWHDLLYQRCSNEDVVGELLIDARISYKDASVNWSKYSKPWDVIFDKPRLGIIQHLVSDLPQEIPKEKPIGGDAKLHNCVPHHVPEPFNYSHSEIWIIKEGQKLTGKLSEIAKKEFRSELSRHAVLLRSPEV